MIWNFKSWNLELAKIKMVSDHSGVYNQYSREDQLTMVVVITNASLL